MSYADKDMLSQELFSKLCVYLDEKGIDYQVHKTVKIQYRKGSKCKFPSEHFTLRSVSRKFLKEVILPGITNITYQYPRVTLTRQVYPVEIISAIGLHEVVHLDFQVAGVPIPLDPMLGAEGEF